MTPGSIVRRYAKALLEIGLEDKKHLVYGKEIAQLAELLENMQELKEVLINPNYNLEERKGVLQEIIKRLELSEMVKNFSVLLLEKDRLRYLSNIVNGYQRLCDEAEGIARAAIRAAQEISGRDKGLIIQSLEKICGKKVIAEVNIDPSLIGGVMVYMGDMVFDGTVNTHLTTMGERLKEQ